MKKKQQRRELITLGALLVLWAASWWTFNRGPASSPSLVSVKAAKAAQQQSLIKTRFHRVRAEMDVLYHYRIKPLPFDTSASPFRIPKGMEGLGGARSATARTTASKPTPDSVQVPTGPVEFGEALLSHAIALARIGGVVTLNNTTQITVNGELHKEGEVFTTKVDTRMILIRIRRLSTASVTLALDDPQNGEAEIRVRLK